jgi:hypothetical protein
MNESEHALPLDDSFWKHVEHLDFKVAIQLDGDKYLNMMAALESIYTLIKDGKTEDAAFFTTGLAAAMLASKYGKSQQVLDEMMVKVFSEDMDKELEHILNEK